MVTLSPEKKLVQQKRRNDVLKLALRNISYDKIAEGLNISFETVQRDMRANRSALMKNVDDVKGVLAKYYARKEECVQEIWKQYQNTGDAKLLTDICTIERDFVKVLRPDVIFQKNEINLHKHDFEFIIRTEQAEVKSDDRPRETTGTETAVTAEPKPAPENRVEPDKAPAIGMELHRRQENH